MTDWTRAESYPPSPRVREEFILRDALANFIGVKPANLYVSRKPREQ